MTWWPHWLRPWRKALPAPPPDPQPEVTEIARSHLSLLGQAADLGELSTRLETDLDETRKAAQTVRAALELLARQDVLAEAREFMGAVRELREDANRARAEFVQLKAEMERAKGIMDSLVPLRGDPLWSGTATVGRGDFLPVITGMAPTPTRITGMTAQLAFVQGERACGNREKDGCEFPAIVGAASLHWYGELHPSVPLAAFRWPRRDWGYLPLLTPIQLDMGSDRSVFVELAEGDFHHRVRLTLVLHGKDMTEEVKRQQYERHLKLLRDDLYSDLFTDH